MTKTNTSPAARTQPLKRPVQARAKFTVQAIYDAYVRIWQRDGWDNLTTRKVALETGIAVGTFYDYFPSREALHSGYVRHCIERMLEQIDNAVIAPDNLTWQERLHGLIHHLAGLDGNCWFPSQMMALEPVVAESRHQNRAYQELLQVWQRTFDACTDLPCQPGAATVEALHLAIWGGRRYALQMNLDPSRRASWAAEMERLCALALSTPDRTDR